MGMGPRLQFHFNFFTSRLFDIYAQFTKRPSLCATCGPQCRHLALKADVPRTGSTPRPLTHISQTTNRGLKAILSLLNPPSTTPRPPSPTSLFTALAPSCCLSNNPYQATGPES